MDPIAGLLTPEDRRRSRTMGLLAAGFGMMSGDSSDTLTNIGTGGLMGIQAYMGANERALEAQQMRQAQLQQMQAQQVRAQQDEQLETILGNISSNWKNYFSNPAEAQLWTARAETAATPEERRELLAELQEDQQPGEVFEGKEGEFWQVAPDGKFSRLNEAPPDLYVPNENETAVRMSLGIPLNAHPDELPGPVRMQLGQGMEEYRRSGATNVTVQGDRERTAQDDALGSMYTRITEQADAAQGSLEQLGAMQSLFESPAMQTGRVQEALVPFKQAASDLLGADLSGLGVQEAFNALSTRATLDASTVLKGSISEKELDLIGSALPSLGKTPAGNRLILETLMRIERRKIEKQRLADEYFDRNNSLRGFNTWLYEWAQSNPLFTEDEQAELILMGGG